jgi:hypothetical protein
MDSLLLPALTLAALAFIGFFVLLFLVFSQKKRIDRLFTGEGNVNIEDFLKQQLDLINTHDSSITRLNSTLGDLDTRITHGFKKIALERFNPFQETGGDQSFVLALLNENDNGFIISSLHSRENTRIYAKEVNNGLSDRKLSEEEQKVLDQLMKQ